jgi:hypothetical protein
MTKTDYAKFATTWRSALAIYGKEMDSATVAAVFAILARYPLRDVLVAINDHMTDPDAGRFQPKPADVVRNIDLRRNAAASAVFDRVLRQLNPYATPAFDDERVAGAVCAVGGWQALCRISNSDIERTRARFVDAYNDNAKPVSTLLRGIVQSDNDDRILARKPELLERFPHPVVTIATKSKELARG